MKIILSARQTTHRPIAKRKREEAGLEIIPKESAGNMTTLAWHMKQQQTLTYQTLLKEKGQSIPREQKQKRVGRKKSKGLRLKRQESPRNYKSNKMLSEKLRQKINLLKSARKAATPERRTTLEKTKELSKRMHSIREHINRLHKNRIDQLLASNELKRIPVEADGNCFFGAIAHSLADPLTENVDEFRSSICDYMLENADRFSCFVTVEPSESQVEELRKQVETLRGSGQWNAKIADCLPLATAEKFNCILRIYSSSLSTPVIDVKPGCSGGNPDKLINIAYLAIKNQEHYEATVPVEHVSAPKQTHRIEPVQESNLNVSASMQFETIQDQFQEDHASETISVTPHKRADYQSPKKKLSSRKKKRNMNQWKANIRKKARTEGKEYITKKGKTVQNRSVKPQNCEKCRFKCNTKFTEDEREQIFQTYYALETYERQRSFICDMILKVTPARKTTGRKSKSLQYYLAIGGRRERVCQNFFLKTLDIGRKTVSYTIERKIHGTFGGKDRRGRHEPSSKVTEDRIKFVREHINSFPRMDSHYTRKNTSKQYLAIRK